MVDRDQFCSISLLLIPCPGAFSLRPENGRGLMVTWEGFGGPDSEVASCIISVHMHWPECNYMSAFKCTAVRECSPSVFPRGRWTISHSMLCIFCQFPYHCIYTDMHPQTCICSWTHVLTKSLPNKNGLILCASVFIFLFPVSGGFSWSLPLGGLDIWSPCSASWAWPESEQEAVSEGLS